MSKQVYLAEGEISCELIKSPRAKRRISLTIEEEGMVKVTLPKWESYKRALKFVQSQQAWIFRQREKNKNKPKSLLSQGSRQDYLRYKEKARRVVNWKLLQFNEYYGFEYKRIAIRDQKSRWGSCSADKNLNFNYRIIHLPDDFSDYLVVHELCHLKEMNHSKRFWNLVLETIPDCKKISRELRRM